MQATYECQNAWFSDRKRAGTINMFYVYVCTCESMFFRVHMCVCARGYGGWKSASGVRSPLLCLLSPGLSLAWRWLAGWLASECSGDTCLFSPVLITSPLEHNSMLLSLAF